MRSKLYSILAGKLGIFAWIIVAASILTIIFVIRGCWTEKSSTRQYRLDVLYELQNARHCLAYTLVCLEQKWQRPAVFDLEHAHRVPELFARDPALAGDVRYLYDELNAEKTQANQLYILLGQKRADRAAIMRRIQPVSEIVAFADRVGPRIASFVGGTWEIPPSGLKLDELTVYYEDRLHRAATDETLVIFDSGERDKKRP